MPGRQVATRVSEEAYRAMREAAEVKDRSVAYLARETLEQKFLKRAHPKPKKRPPVDERLGEAFDHLWHGWKFEHAAGVGPKAQALAAFTELMAKVPADQWAKSAELILECAREMNYEKRKEIDRGARDVIKLPQVHRFLSERRFEGAVMWQKERNRRRR